MSSSHLANNPFYVLELRPAATRPDVERQGGRLLSMLEVGIARSARFDTPVGEQARTPEAVRVAMAELREPDRRLRHELWATLPPGVVPAGEAAEGAPEPDSADPRGPLPELWTLAGWRRRS